MWKLNQTPFTNKAEKTLKNAIQGYIKVLLHMFQAFSSYQQKTYCNPRLHNSNTHQQHLDYIVFQRKKSSP